MPLLFLVAIGLVNTVRGPWPAHAVALSTPVVQLVISAYQWSDTVRV
jgi:hypothetical protein